MSKSDIKTTVSREAEEAMGEEAGLVDVQPISETLESNYMPYAMSVIISRAIPEIDGFKPSHRKLLYTMYLMGLLRGNRTKSANIVGQTMKLNPHGDLTIYDTMVRLTRGNAALLHPYIDSKGNMGKQYSRDMQSAAPRYTEARLAAFASEIFNKIDHEVVDFIPNYDGTMMEPTLLPTAFPSILVNANQGIAVGMASNICSFNLREVCEATAAYMEDPNIDLMEYMPAPDFSGGASLIHNEEDMRKIYETGRGGFKLRARYRYDKKTNMIEVFEIPYSTTVEAIIEDITKLVKTGKLKDITDVRDETDLEGLRITMDLRRGIDPDDLMNRLYKQTVLESSFSCNFNILVNGTPRVMGVAEILDEWLVFRRETMHRGLTYDLTKNKERLHLLEGLAAILLDIDLAIKLIRETELEKDVIPNLMSGFSISEPQANYVAEIRLRNINREYILKRTQDRERLEKEVKRLERIINSPKLLDKEIAKDLVRVADKFGEDRRTEIIDADEVVEVSTTELIEDFNLKLFLTKDGYLKKLALTSLRSAGDLRLKESDYITHELEASNRQVILIFTNKANLYKQPIHELEDDKPSHLGTFLPNLLELEDGEVPIAIVPAGNYEGFCVFAYKNGRMSRVDISEYETKTRRRKLVKAYNDKHEIAGIVYLEEETDLALINEREQLLVLSSELIPQMATRSNQGVIVLRKRKNAVDEVRHLLTVEELRTKPFFSEEDPEYYRIRTLPASGRFLKSEALEERQKTLEELIR